MTGLAPVTTDDAVPVSLFGSVMGLAALSTNWRAAGVSGWPAWPAGIFGVLAVLGLVGLAAAYLVKAKRRPKAIVAEFANPLTRNFFGMPLISLLLVPPVVAPFSPSLAVLSWSVGVGGMVIFACIQLSRWLAEPQQRSSVTSAWLVVAVGILDIPLAMPALGLPSENGFGAACLIIGSSVAAVLYAYTVRRCLIGPPVPAAQIPTLLIAVAPLAVGCSSYTIVSGRNDHIASLLLGLAVAALATLAIPVGRHLARTSFTLTWWSTGFPIAATAGAALRVANDRREPFADALAISLLLLATLLISGLVLRTAVGTVVNALRSRPT